MTFSLSSVDVVFAYRSHRDRYHAVSSCFMSIVLIWYSASKHALYFPRLEHSARMAHNILADISPCIFVNIKYYNGNENVVHLCSW